MTAQEFLVTITITLPADMPEQQRKRLLTAEHHRGKELRSQDAIRRIWRLPGKPANIGVWAAESPTELHHMITSLPLYPWMTVEIVALAQHPLETDP